MSDLIDRKAAIDVLEERLKANGCSNVALVSELNRSIGYLMQLPSAQPEQRWIPCSEILPETTDPVIITWVNHKPECYYEYIKDKPFVATGHYYNGRWYWFSDVCQDYLNEYGECEMDRIDSAVEVIAWMPLPSPYKEEN